MQFEMFNLVRVVKIGWKSFKIYKPQFKFKVSESYHYGRKYNPAKRNERESCFDTDDLCMITAVIIAATSALRH